MNTQDIKIKAFIRALVLAKAVRSTRRSVPRWMRQEAEDISDALPCWEEVVYMLEQKQIMLKDVYVQYGQRIDLEYNELDSMIQEVVNK